MAARYLFESGPLLFYFPQNNHWSCSAHICVSLRSHLRLAALTFVMTISLGVATSIIAFQETRARLRGRESYENASHRCSVCNLEWLQLPSPTAGGAESVQLKGLHLQNRGRLAAKASLFQARSWSVRKESSNAHRIENGRSEICSALWGLRSCPKQSNDRDRSQNGGPSIYRIPGHEAGHRKRYIRATDRHHLWPLKGKKTSGEETGERPFLYVVGENKAFIDDGNPDSLGAIAYRAICINPDLRGQDSRQQPSRE